MQLTLTIDGADLNKLSEEITQVPKLEFTHESNEYWVLLPFFEKVEEVSGKLIDLGESIAFTAEEQEKILELIEKELEDIPEKAEELFLQDDGELLSELLEKIRGMVRIGQISGGHLSAISSES